MSVLLFDVDNTLLDFDDAENKAIQKIFNEYDIPVTDENFKTYEQINKELWIRHERKEISRKELFTIRFPKVFEALGISVNENAEIFDEKYRNYLAETATVIDGAIEVLETLFGKGFNMGIVTNGTPKVSRPRIENSGIEKYFSGIFVSEEIGVNKPDEGFFEIVFDQMKIDKKETFIIGDTLTSDILGGNNAGIRSIWYNSKRVENYTSIQPTIEIQDLRELLTIFE